MSGSPSEKQIAIKPSWFVTIYNVAVKSVLIPWAFAALGADTDEADRQAHSVIEGELSKSTRAAFTVLCAAEIGAATLKAEQVFNSNVSTTNRIKAVLGTVASASAATGCYLVNNDPTVTAPPYLFITTFSLNALIDLISIAEKLSQKKDSVGMAMDAANLTANLFEALGGVYGGIINAFAPLEYAASVVSFFQGGINLANKLRPMPVLQDSSTTPLLIDDKHASDSDSSLSHSSV